MKKSLLPQNPVYRVCSQLFFYGIGVPLLTVLDFFWFGLIRKNRKVLKEKIPKGQGAVIVCNHVHNFDCTFVGLTILPRRAVFTSLDWLFDRRIIGPLIRFMGSVPVPTSLKGMRDFLEQMREAAQKGRWICLYPEGAIEPYCEELREFRDGAFSIAVKAQVPVVPLVLTYRPGKGIWKWKRRPCFTMTVGEPLWPSPGKEKEAVQALSRETRKRMEEMLAGKEKEPVNS